MLPSLRIHSEMGTLASHTVNARIIGGPGLPPGYEMRMKNNGGVKVALKTEHPRILIDQTDPWADVMLKHPLAQALEVYDKALDKGIEWIASIAREGVRMLRIEREHNAIPNISRDRVYHDVQLTIKKIRPPKITGVPGHVVVRDATEELQTDWVDVSKKGRYIAGSVTTRIEQKPYVDITVDSGNGEPFLVRQGRSGHVDYAM